MYVAQLSVPSMASNSSKTGKNSSEYKVVKNQFGSIVKQSQHVLPMLASELFSNELIGELQHGKAMNNTQPEYNRASELIISILTKIERDSSCYSKFLSALKESDLGGVADDLDSALRTEKSHCSPAIPCAKPGEWVLSSSIYFESVCGKWENIS